MKLTSALLGVPTLAIVAALACQNTSVQAQPNQETESKTAPTPTPAVFSPAEDRDNRSVFDRLPDVSEQAVKSVVNISSTKTVVAQEFGPGSPFQDPFFRRFFQGPNGPAQRNERSLGSGVIVTRDGTILTNNHVVQDADQIQVVLSDEREYQATVIGADPASDLAVVKLTDPPDDLTPLQFGDSSELRLGEAVIAIGNPFGVGQTVTLGIVSAKGRTNVGIVDYADFIQTDAAINPGNSGGALVNMKGELVGINTAILSRSGGYQGIGFAIPSNMASTLMDDLLDDGQVSRGFLGVFIQDLNPSLAEKFGVEGTRGVLVSDVMPDGPAAEAGIRPGDIILKVDGVEVDTAARLRLVIASKGGDKKVKLELLRDGRSKTMNVRLTEKGDEGAPRSPAAEEDKDAVGLRLAPLTDTTRQRLGLEGLSDGAVVAGVQPNSPAARAGLRVGDVIVEVNRQDVGTPEEAARRLGEADGDILLRVVRRGATIFVVIDR
ncbi:MAG: DegQ family serine endoprotease [Myxococcota bacterium]